MEIPLLIDLGPAFDAHMCTVQLSEYGAAAKDSHAPLSLLQVKKLAVAAWIECGELFQSWCLVIKVTQCARRN